MRFFKLLAWFFVFFSANRPDDDGTQVLVICTKQWYILPK
jgi:hypothetical protein